MNKLKVYLSASTRETQFREFCHQFYSEDFNLIDPLKYDIEENNNAFQRVKMDSELMNGCDVLVAFVNTPSCGTSMEIYHFNKIKKLPVYIINENGKHKQDFWLVANSEKIFDSIVKCFEYLKREFIEKGEINMSATSEELKSRYSDKNQEIVPEIKCNEQIKDTPTGKFLPVATEDFCKIVEKNCEEAERVIKENEKIWKKEKLMEETKKPWEIDDSKTATRLLEKNYSPMIIRRYNAKNWPMFVAIICDYDLTDLDEVVVGVMDEWEKMGLFTNEIQKLRNFTGYLSDSITKYYNAKKKGCVEGVAIIAYFDKIAISSLTNDFMSCTNCKIELFNLLTMMTQI